MVKILMLSKWHVHAEEYANTVRSQPDAQISCVWDDDVQRGKKWAESLGAAFEPDFEKAITRADVDAVVVDTPTTDHRKVITAAANAGKHIYTEKTMAVTMEDAKVIADAIRKNNVKFGISFPHLTHSYVQYCKQAIKDGLIGKVHYMRMRNAHAGALQGWLPSYWYDTKQTGGGAMLDLGCHPMYIASYLLGKPKRIASMYNNSIAPQDKADKSMFQMDDNAVSVVEFENKAIAVLETSFISPFNGDCFELLGTEGAVVRIGNEVKIRSNKIKDGGWFIPDKLPSPLQSAIRFWLDGIIKGAEIPFDLEKAIALTELLENAYISDKEQRIMSI